MTVRRALRPSKTSAKTLSSAALALAIAAVAPLTATTPARAQFFGGWGGWDNGGSWDGMEPQQVRRALGQRGFRVLAPLRRNGNVFVADVLDQRGQHERLIVAAADAQILQRFMVDDGRQPGAFPRGTDDGRDFTARGADDDRGLVPPGSIPDAAGGRRFARPSDRQIDRDAAPPQRFGDLAPADDAGAASESPLHRPPPPIRTVKPRPRVVERTPEPPTGGREPGPVEATPLAPAAPRPAVTAPAPVAKAPAPAPAVPQGSAPASVPAVAPAPAVASRPEPAPAAPASAPATTAAPAAPARRMADPLAIPGGEAKPVRNVAAGITGAPAPAPVAKPAAPTAAAAPAPAKPADVPVAPLD